MAIHSTVNDAFFFSLRLDKELQTIEMTNSVSSRWTSSTVEYKKELQSKIFSKCSGLHKKLKTVCEERLFLLRLKEKYSGNFENTI